MVSNIFLSNLLCMVPILTDDLRRGSPFVYYRTITQKLNRRLNMKRFVYYETIKRDLNKRPEETESPSLPSVLFPEEDVWCVGGWGERLG